MHVCLCVINEHSSLHPYARYQTEILVPTCDRPALDIREPLGCESVRDERRSNFSKDRLSNRGVHEKPRTVSASNFKEVGQAWARELTDHIRDQRPFEIERDGLKSKHGCVCLWFQDVPEGATSSARRS